MTSLICTKGAPQIRTNGSRILCAISIPGSNSIVAATEASELIYGDETTVKTESYARGIASIKYTSFAPDALPDEKAIVLVLIDGVGLQIFSFPDLKKVYGSVADELISLTKRAHIFSVDSLGSDLVGESFRVAVAVEESVSLLDISITQNRLKKLANHMLPERVAAVSFSEMTIVASTLRTHYLLRISRGGGLAIAATVSRSEKPRRAPRVGDGGVAVFSFFGDLFRSRDLSQNIVQPVAFALPENRWLLIVDRELVAYSSFGAKLEDMENVFKSKSGMDLRAPARLSSAQGSEERSSLPASSIAKSSSVSSFTSLATGISHRTYLDESQAKRSEKPPVRTVFSSPLVLSVTTKNKLMAFAANGSVQGVMDEINLFAEEENSEAGVKLISSREGNMLGLLYWPSGKVVRIELSDNLETLIEQREAEKELRLALALVPANQVERMIRLRRQLAAEAREQEWHDAAIHHMEVVVNLSVKREGVDQVDLVAEAVDLRGTENNGWQADAVTATMWADFLFRLRRRIMRPSSADVDVLESLCSADEFATRIKALFSVKHDVPLTSGESLITSTQCLLREDERVEALVSFYTSLSEHGKALLLLENSDSAKSFDRVVGYLSKSMKPNDDQEVFFSHLKWLAQRADTESHGNEKLEALVREAIDECADSSENIGLVFNVLVEDAEDLIETLLNDICGPASAEEDDVLDEKETDSLEKETGSVSASVLASALLSAMAKADSLEKRKLFENIRSLFGSRILYRRDAEYQSSTLLQALQTPQNKALGLHEELAFLLGRQGRHEAAADELAAEKNLLPEEALYRLSRMLPASDRPSAREFLIAAYLRVSSQGRALRIKDASKVLQSGAGFLDVEKLLLDGRCSNDSLSLSEMQPMLEAALVSGSERLRTAEIVRALRKSEVRRMREEVLARRRRSVVVGHDRACTLCTRRIGDSVFAAYPGGSVAHLACHMSKDSRQEQHMSQVQ